MRRRGEENTRFASTELLTRLIPINELQPMIELKTCLVRAHGKVKESLNKSTQTDATSLLDFGI